jgi:hypothetical protein
MRDLNDRVGVGAPGGYRLDWRGFIRVDLACCTLRLTQWKRISNAWFAGGLVQRTRAREKAKTV